MKAQNTADTGILNKELNGLCGNYEVPHNSQFIFSAVIK